MIPIQRFILGLFMTSLAAGAAERLGSVSGIVTYSDGPPVVSATVGYLREAPLNQAAPKAAFTTSGSSGAFALTGLAAGTYAICVMGPSTADWVDPCLWSDTPTRISMTPGQIVSGIKVAVQRATKLQIHVSDPTAALATNEGSKAGGLFVLGVWSSRHIFIRGSIVSKQNTDRVYQLPVPPTTTFRVGVQSSLYRMQDETGKPIVSGVVKDQLPIAAGTTTSTINLSITGTVLGTVP